MKKDISGQPELIGGGLRAAFRARSGTRSGQHEGPVPTATRASRVRLTGLGLRRLKEHLFKLQSALIEDMIRGGINISKVTAVSHVARAIGAVEVLQVRTRER
jgi:hypothetical protein